MSERDEAVWKAYDEAMGPADATYKEATTKARKAYEEVLGPAQVAFREATTPARMVYEAAVARAQRDLDEAEIKVKIKGVQLGSL